MRHSKVWNQVQEREEENPDDVDEMPVQPHYFHGAVIRGAELSLLRSPDDPAQETDADDHVQCMQSCHSPIEHHEQLDFRRELGQFVPGEMRAGEKTFVPVLKVFEALD